MKRIVLALSVTVISPLFHPATAMERNPQQAVAPSKEMGSENYFAFSSAIQKNQLDIAQGIAEKTKSPFAERALKVKKMTPQMSWANVLETAKNLQKYDKFMETSKPSSLIETKKEEEAAAPQSTGTKEETGTLQLGEPEKKKEAETQKEENTPLPLPQQLEDPKTSAMPSDQFKDAPGSLFIKEMEAFFSNREKDECQKTINSNADEEAQKDIKEKIESDKKKLALLSNKALGAISFAKGIMTDKGYEKKYQELLAEMSKNMYAIMDSGIKYCRSKKMERTIKKSNDRIGRAIGNLSEAAKARLEAKRGTHQQEAPLQE